MKEKKWECFFESVFIGCRRYPAYFYKDIFKPHIDDILTISLFIVVFSFFYLLGKYCFELTDIDTLVTFSFVAMIVTAILLFFMWRFIVFLANLGGFRSE